MKIELKHLAPYLPYGLKVQYIGSLDDENKRIESGYIKIGEIANIGNIEIRYQSPIIWMDFKRGYFGISIDQIKPILRPLSDYTDITSKSMSDLDCDLTDQMDIQEFALKKMSLSSLLYSSFDVLTRNHVDIFGLIPEGLAIDINTINP